MKFFTMYSALAWILDAEFSASFEVIMDRPDSTGAMPQVPIFSELSADDAAWIARYFDGGIPGVEADGLFRVVLGGEAETGAIYVFYSGDGDIVRVYATRYAIGG